MHLSFIYSYTLLGCLFICLGVCLFVSNKRQNVWTDWAQIFLDFTCSQEMFINDSFAFKKIRLLLNFVNPAIFFYKIHEHFLFFFIPCIEIEEKMSAKRPKRLVSKTDINLLKEWHTHYRYTLLTFKCSSEE